MEPNKPLRAKDIFSGPRISDEEYMRIQNENDRKRRFRENRDVTIFIIFILVLAYFAVSPLQYTLTAIMFICAGPLVWITTRRSHIGFLGILPVFMLIGGLIAIISFGVYLYSFFG